jgi:hypothetical protein
VLFDGEVGNLRYDNFLPKLDTLNDETKGLNVPFLEIFDNTEKTSETNSTANWLVKHIQAKSDLISVSAGENLDDETKCDYTAKLDLNFELKNKKSKQATCKEVTKNTDTLGYYPVDAIYKTEGQKPVLAVNIPKNNT